MTGTHDFPNEIWADPMFARDMQDRPLTKIERLSWLATHVRYEDNCVLRRKQGAWSLRYLAEAWRVTKKAVECTLKAFEKRGWIRVGKGVVEGTVQTIITYLVSRPYEAEKSDKGTARGQFGDNLGTNTKTGNTGKEDSPYSPPGGDSDWEDPFSDTAPRAAGAGPSTSAPADPAPEPSPNSATPPPKPKRERRAAKVVAPDWTPKPETVAWAKGIGASEADIRAEVDRFIDYGAQSGKGYLDHDAAFRNWMRNWKDRQASKPAYRKQSEFCI